MHPWVWIDSKALWVPACTMRLSLALEMEQCLPPTVLESGLTYLPINNRILCHDQLYRNEGQLTHSPECHHEALNQDLGGALQRK